RPAASTRCQSTARTALGHGVSAAGVGDTGAVDGGAGSLAVWMRSSAEMSTVFREPRLLAVAPWSAMSTTTKKMVLLLSESDGNAAVFAGTRKRSSSLLIL